LKPYDRRPVATGSSCTPCWLSSSNLHGLFLLLSDSVWVLNFSFSVLSSRSLSNVGSRQFGLSVFPQWQFIRVPPYVWVRNPRAVRRIASDSEPWLCAGSRC